MNFKKVEIYGFKSFADRAEIEFGKGITGIVGPNGCGKSNVADAVRWVLGEQSAKNLRGGSMQDVIFSGTQNRKSLSYCEVSLFFDNSDKMFSLDYSEVIITRKLYRDGKSEYFINKQEARLKDIINLLHECGIGKEGYTIIGQGRVEEIMSAKPEDRRLIFEEATGIAKFKTDKNETERKLIRTHENVVRYADIMTEIENQLSPLEKQANKAKEFNEISQELKYKEINTYIYKVEGVASAKEKINLKLKAIDEETALRKEELSSEQKEYEKLLTEINSSDENLRKLNDEMLEKRLYMEQNSSAKQLYQEKISYLLSQIDRGNKEIEENKNTLEESKQTLILNKKSLLDAKEMLHNTTKESDVINAKLQKTNEKITLGEEIASISQKKVIESIESLSDIKQSSGVMSATQRGLQEKLEELKLRLTDLSFKHKNNIKEKEELENSLKSTNDLIINNKNLTSNKEEEVKAINEQDAAYDREIYALNSIVTSLATKDKFYREMKENYEGYAPSIKLLFSDAKSNSELSSRLLGVVGKIINCDKKFDVALETALASSAQNVVTTDTEDTKYLIKYLKLKNYNRLTFLPLSSVKPRVQSYEVTSALKETGALGVANKLVSYDSKFEKVISNLLCNTLIVDTLDNATNIANKYSFTFKIVTLEGDEFSTRGAMSGGSRRKDAFGVLSNERKIDDNAELLKAKSLEMNKLRASKKEIEIKRDNALTELNELNEKYKNLHQLLITNSEKQSLTEKVLFDENAAIENLNESIEDVAKRLNKVSQDYNDASKGSIKLEENKKIASEEANKSQAEYEKMRLDRDKLSEQSSKLQVKIAELKGQIVSLDSDTLRLNSVISDCESSINSLKTSNINAEEIIENLRREEEKVALTKEEQDNINKLRSDIENTQNNKIKLREKINSNDTKKANLTNEITLLAEKRHDKELELTKIDSDLEYMGQSIFEDYQESYESALKLKDSNFDLTKGESDIIKLRKKRSSLGAINATAIDDYKILKDRYDEMTTQKDDLIKAENDLKVAIDKIKGEMLTQFDAGFKQINENFQHIFKELFGGGKAMLQIDYGEVDDKLEAGIEIVAEPPGKKLQKLSLLSGGEKALTAISILFAILKLRPMPFCILDEIEAALDEANVDRFARYLQKYAMETQFIVITHRKPTMMLADSLFGVTMPEKGVSRLVSVKMSDVAQIEGDAMVN